MNSVNYKRLEKSLTDVIQEAQLKIDHHPITLYYPTESVARLLGTPEEDADNTEHALASLSAHTADTLGAIQVTRDDKRFCFHISAEGTQYVHEQLPDPAFLRAFLQVMRGLTVSFDDILAVFHQFSDKVHCEKLEGNEEFDYLVYFEDGTPDSYRYCIKLDDDGDAVYHRFTPEDYAAFGF
mgnify:FL=1